SNRLPSQMPIERFRLYVAPIIATSIFGSSSRSSSVFSFFFFNDTATTEIYTLSLHDALPIFRLRQDRDDAFFGQRVDQGVDEEGDRKSTRLNSSHVAISYAVFCLKKKKKRSQR